MAKKLKARPDQLKLTNHSGDGSAGTDADPNNPLARALNSLFITGRPFQRFSACYFSPLPVAKGIRWFGTFVFSDGGRLIYFPGLAEAYNSIWVSDKQGEKKTSFKLDHVSLESSLRDWHLTTRGSTNHIGRFPTADLGEGRVLWFGMSIAAETLRPLREKTEVQANIPPNDVRRRQEAFIQSRDGVVYNTLMLSTTDRHLSVPSFIHFSVIAGPCGFPDYTGDQWGFPIGSPYISPALPNNLFNLPLRGHRVSLAPHVDLQITTAVLPGRVIVPVTFTSPAP